MEVVVVVVVDDDEDEDDAVSICIRRLCISMYARPVMAMKRG